MFYFMSRFIKRRKCNLDRSTSRVCSVVVLHVYILREKSDKDQFPRNRYILQVHVNFLLYKDIRIEHLSQSFLYINMCEKLRLFSISLSIFACTCASAFSALQFDSVFVQDYFFKEFSFASIYTMSSYCSKRNFVNSRRLPSNRRDIFSRRYI